MNDKQLNYLCREFDRLRPIFRSDLRLVVTPNYIYWFTEVPGGECFYIDQEPLQDDRISLSEECGDGKELYHQGKRILENLQDPVLDFKDESKRATGVRLLWWDHYWDGPLAGTCEWNGKRYYFSNIDPHLREYQYTMREMYQPEWDARYQQHLLFQQYVGNYTDYHYDENGKELHRPRDFSKPESERAKYRDAQHPPIPISEHPASAWFQR